MREDAAKADFVAGTGRSGTTLLHDMIGAHPSVYAVPGESKFIVEGDGLNALIPALTGRYSVTASDLALLRFMVLMGLDLPAATQTEGTEFGRALAERIGPQFFHPPLQRYIAALTDFNFGFGPDVIASPYPKHFEDRRTLIRLSHDLVADMFGGAAQAAGKRIWCEKTPSNLIAIDLLWEMFPKAAIIHIKRDPRGVLHSLMQQDWAPHDLAQATSFLRHIYIRWKRLKPRLGLPDPRYLEIKLEDLCAAPEQVMAQVAGVIGIAPAFRLSGTKAAMADRWKTEMSAADRAYCETKLADIFDLMGYDR